MTTPAGWYDDGSGRQRWWDGQQWTEHLAPDVAAPETTASGYPATASAAPTAVRTPSVLGLIGLGLSVLGTILVCIPLIGLVGLFPLAAGFIVSLVSLFLKGGKWPGIAGLVLAVVGSIIGIVVSSVIVIGITQSVSRGIDDLPAPSPSIEATAPSETDGVDGADEGVRPTAAEVAAGLTTLLSTTGTEGFTETEVTCIADALVASELDDATLRQIADGTLTDVDAAYRYTEALTDTEAIAACFNL